VSGRHRKDCKITVKHRQQL